MARPSSAMESSKRRGGGGASPGPGAPLRATRRTSTERGSVWKGKAGEWTREVEEKSDIVEHILVIVLERAHELREILGLQDEIVTRLETEDREVKELGGSGAK